MPETNYQKLVAFHLAADGQVPETPSLPAADVIDIRKTLIREEYAEVMAAFSVLEQAAADGREPDLASLAHELSDLLYVVYGTFAAFGIDADAVFAEVHEANMRKMGGPRRADGKLLKPPGWQPADVQGVLAALIRQENPPQ